MKFRVYGFTTAVMILCIPAVNLFAQVSNPEDATIDGIRRLQQIGNLDQDSMRRWIQHEVDNLSDLPKAGNADGFHASGFKTFRTRFTYQRNNPNNSNAFITQLAIQTATIAVNTFTQINGKISANRAIARVLVDMSTIETLSALLAGLSSGDQTTRYFCARGLSNLRTTIIQNNKTLNQVMQALRKAGKTENNAVALGQIYNAISISNEPTSALDAYLDIFDQRLTKRRNQAVISERADLYAFDYFRQPGKTKGLNQAQLTNLVQRLAVFLRLDTNRLNDPMLAPPVDKKQPDLGFIERDIIFRKLVAIEEILENIVGAGKGGNVRNIINNEGFEGRRKILAEVARWVGDTTANKPGALNEAPWNVSIGAP